jgi:hypothetical protein
MRLPIDSMVGMASILSKEFAVGWANGLVRWNRRVAVRAPYDLAMPYTFPRNKFERHSVPYAASEAAIAFMIEREEIR